MQNFSCYLLSFFSFFLFVFPTYAKFKVSLGAEFDYYLSPVEFTDLSQNIVNIKPKIVYTSATKLNQNYFLIDVEALVSSEFLDSHFLVPEFFYSYLLSSNKGNKSSLVIGRKKINWSLLEQDWSLGIFSPYFSINPLRPEEQGVVGVFYQYRSLSFSLDLFASPIFLPHQSGTVDIKDKKILIYNRWNSFLYYENILNKSILYTLEDINIAQFVQRWSLGFWLKKNFSNFFITASYFYKPYSDPYAYANISENISSGEDSGLQVLVTVRPVMHQVVSVEGEIKQKNFSEYLSIVIDRPQVFNLLDNDKYSALVNKNIFASGIKYKNLLTSLDLGVLYTQHNIVKRSALSVGSDLRGIDAVYAYPYKTAVFTQLKKKNLLLSEDEVFLKYTYLFDSQLEILSFKYTKKIKKHNLIFGFDILGHPFSDQVQGVFAANVANDFIYIGWSYVI